MTERDNSFAGALRNAFEQPRADDRIRDIKNTVSNRLQTIDRHMTVKWTDYFNHSFAPDMVLRWPRENRERHVFLRANPARDWLASDLRFVGKQRPIFLTLSELRTETPADGEQPLADAASEAESLITDPDAIDAFQTARAGGPIVGLLSQAVIQGGRGIVDSDAARTLSRITSVGFDAAGSLDTEATREATSAMVAAFEPRQAGRMTRMLQAVWEGNGGSLVEFPGQPDFSGPLTDDDLVFLLETIDTEDLTFWRSVGRTLNLEQLAHLDLEDPSPGLQRLVTANLDGLYAKAFRLRGDLAADGDTPRWMVSHGCLAVRGQDWTAYLAPSRLDQLPKGDERDGLPVESLRERTNELRVKVGNVQLQRGDLAITYETSGSTSVVDEDELTQLSSADGRPSARVVRATITLAGDRRLVCDFPSATSFGHTNAMFPVAELLRVSLATFMVPSTDEAEGLKVLLTGYEEESEPDLFSAQDTLVEEGALLIGPSEASDSAPPPTDMPAAPLQLEARGEQDPGEGEP